MVSFKPKIKGGIIMNSVCTVILAAGEGTRMKSSKPKVLAEVLFKPMIDWVISAAKNGGPRPCAGRGLYPDVLLLYDGGGGDFRKKSGEGLSGGVESAGTFRRKIMFRGTGSAI